ncbi:hypothetical protein KDH_07020 [Dictyobacter sp. S3.2.2.5]|uniref:DUF488 domain-containing protein n=1 Tax=Dictyobacter halimunensis TaxID=3026934 RepID=A0ABQ6FJT8_9CHLR|nr:hypothetical protein KDH_07020 [Dictyobacter sp. S3.2.2.5]
MSSKSLAVNLKRVYEEKGPDDGTRVLVERLWPRGISKEKAQIDLWLKEVAPSNDLRRWFGHDPERFTEFCHRYEKELDADEAKAGLEKLSELAQKGPVTLVFATHDVEHSSAMVLRDMLAHRKHS